MRELAQHMMDLVENSVRAGAKRIEVELDIDSGQDLLTLRVTDDGCGMPTETALQAVDPFFTSRSCRHVGLGLPLLAASTQRCAGDLQIDSQPGRGTKVVAAFRLSHIDTPPLGDLKSTIICAIVGHPAVNLCYRHVSDGRGFELDSGTVKSELGDVPISHPAVLGWLEQAVSNGLAAAGVSVAREEE